MTAYTAVIADISFCLVSERVTTPRIAQQLDVWQTDHYQFCSTDNDWKNLGGATSVSGIGPNAKVNSAACAENNNLVVAIRRFEGPVDWPYLIFTH